VHLDLPEQIDRHAAPPLERHHPERRHRELPSHDHDRDPRRAETPSHQADEDRRNEELVRDRIQQRPERRDLVPAAGDVPVEQIRQRPAGHQTGAHQLPAGERSEQSHRHKRRQQNPQ